MPRKKCATGRVKWAHLCEIDYRTKVGTPAWKGAHTHKQAKLSAWRRLHMFGGHATVRAIARARGVGMSSRMHLGTVVNAAVRAGASVKG